MPTKKNASKVSKESAAIESLILIIRGQKVILDSDLASLYGVPTKAFNQAIKRNLARFPEDFIFRLNKSELKKIFCLRSQFVTSNEKKNRSQFVTGSQKHRDPRFFPYAFTEHGAIMAANVLNSPSAVQMSVFIVRAFMRMRAVLSGHQELMAELLVLEKKLTDRLDVHEIAIVDILRRMMELLDPPAQKTEPPKPKIGFHV